MKTKLLIIFFLIANDNLAQSNIQVVANKLNFLNNDTILSKYDSSQKQSFKKLNSIVSQINNVHSSFKKLGGSISFGLNGNTSKNYELFNLNTAVSISKKSYPNEFSVSTRNNVQIENNTLQENLSNLHMSFDHFMTDIEKYISIETYTFVNKRSDALLGVNNRYEMGIGFIAAHWGKIKDNAKRTSYKSYTKDSLVYLNNDNMIVCNTKKCTPLPNLLLTKKDIEILEKTRKKVARMTLKKHSPYRIGMLVGIFYEAESIKAKDSIIYNNETKLESVLFPTQNKIRWELRPTIDFKISSNTSIKIRPYFKLPLPTKTQWKVNVNGIKKIDYRVDFPISLKINIVNGLNMGIDYSLFYDNAPSSQGFDVIGLPTQYLTANKKHHFINFSVGYNL